ncbi:MAG: hypothetical protein AAGA11_18700 [Pseudomonadota bacterium]
MPMLIRRAPRQLLAAVLLVGCAHAADVALPCDDIGQVFAHQAQLASGGVDGAVDHTALQSRPDACETVVNPAQATVRCVWPYAFGSPEAWSTYQHFVKAARACVGPLFSESESKPVNHPDAYYAHQFRFRGAVLAVTFKHKSALRQTLVSIRVDG